MTQHDPLTFSYDEIVKLVEPQSTVLDLGCGDGELLLRLMKERHVRGRGVDIQESMIQQCISKGISVFHGNLDEGLKDYSTGSYDYVILNRTLQVVHNPVLLLSEMIRVGRQAIVNFPNFGYIVNRLQLTFQGRMPVNKNLPFQWYNTPNIHFCTRKDFLVLCGELGIPILQEIAITRGRRNRLMLRNLLSSEVCFVLQGQVSTT
jgi:methionine biosynthesis protein MetW